MLFAWLVAWIYLSWPAIQDDALIHLRYAANLRHFHQITYDGIHPDYGASSLLYVYLLAILRGFTSSPELPHAVSSAAHMILFAGLLVIFYRYLSRAQQLAGLLGVTLLVFVVVPSAVRWLDDGMETSLVLCCVTLLCWFTFRQSGRRVTPTIYLLATLEGFFTVILRTELTLVCGLCWLILTLEDVRAARNTSTDHFAHDRSGRGAPAWLKAAIRSSHLVVGALCALIFIFLKMHALLPDTALAKSHGISVWKDVLSSSGQILIGALTFGVGLLCFWLITLVVLIRAGRMSISATIANSVYPITMLLASLRGQEIQGARYIAWTLYFSILWNVLTMAAPASGEVTVKDDRTSRRMVYGLLIVVILFQPLESKWMFHVLHGRAKTIARFESQHLDNLHDRVGVAFDIGYIGYFSQAQICDLAGLVNGRLAAQMTIPNRTAACVARNPAFVFGNILTIALVSKHMSMEGWQICGEYDFVNLRQPDTHYLMVPPLNAAAVCHATTGTEPYPVSTVFTPPNPIHY